MIDTVEELKLKQKIYIVDFSMYMNTKINYAVYTVEKIERRGVGKWFVRFSTNAKNDNFKKTINATFSYSLSFNNNFKVYETFKEAKQDYCKMVRKDEDKNPKLFKILSKQYPEYFL